MHVCPPIRICIYSKVDIIYPYEKMRASDNHMHCVESVISQYVNVDKAMKRRTRKEKIKKREKRLKAERQQVLLFFRDAQGISEYKCNNMKLN